MAEKLVNKCGISYEEAANILKEANFDMLEAMIILEKRGMLGGSNSKYTTGIMQNYHSTGEKTAFDADNIREFLHLAWHKFCDILKDVMKYKLRLKRCGEHICTMPLIMAIILVCVFSYIIIPAIIVGLVLEFSIEIVKNGE